MRSTLRRTLRLSFKRQLAHIASLFLVFLRTHRLFRRDECDVTLSFLLRSLPAQGARGTFSAMLSNPFTVEPAPKQPAALGYKTMIAPEKDVHSSDILESAMQFFRSLFPLYSLLRPVTYRTPHEYWAWTRRKRLSPVKRSRNACSTNNLRAIFPPYARMREYARARRAHSGSLLHYRAARIKRLLAACVFPGSWPGRRRKASGGVGRRCFLTRVERTQLNAVKREGHSTLCGHRDVWCPLCFRCAYAASLLPLAIRILGAFGASAAP